jgi:hypothetical protein
MWLWLRAHIKRTSRPLPSCQVWVSGLLVTSADRVAKKNSEALSAKRRLCNTVGITATGCAADCCAISAPLLETNCLAGHVRFEPANPFARYLIEIA